jgi:adenine-specific DNA-methyltransferase
MLRNVVVEMNGPFSLLTEKSYTLCMSAEAPVTQAIKYTGSKLKLLPHILSLSAKVGPRTVFDGFSGSTRVSQAYAKTGYRVYANDAAVYSEVFNTAWLLNRREPETYRPLIDHLNALPPVDGWFTEHYGGDEERAGLEGPGLKKPGFKKPWQKKNTRKLDAIREEIDRLNLDGLERAVAITSLILALDQVDSTLGHYVSYLNQWSPRSYQDLKLSIPRLWINTQDHVVMRDDIFAAVKKLPDGIDLAYLDPPYGSNNEKMPPSRVRYASYSTSGPQSASTTGLSFSARPKGGRIPRTQKRLRCLRISGAALPAVLS